jgi:hypothetical protein
MIVNWLWIDFEEHERKHFLKNKYKNFSKNTEEIDLRIKKISYSGLILKGLN